MATVRPRRQSSDQPVTQAERAPESQNNRQHNRSLERQPPRPGVERAATTPNVGPPPAARAQNRAGPGSAPEMGDSASIGVQLWLPQSFLRPSAAWVMVAALLAFGLFARSFFVDWRMIALGLLLADPLWGSIWRLAGGRGALLPLPRQAQTRTFWLPYLRPGSPAAEILGAETPGPGTPGADARQAGAEPSVLPLAFRVAVPTLALPLAIGWVLGAQAMWLTAGVIAVSGLGWIGRQFLYMPPSLLQSLVTVTLPWILALSLLNMSRTHEMIGFHAALILLWTLHHWGQVRVTRRDEALHASGDRGGPAHRSARAPGRFLQSGFLAGFARGNDPWGIALLAAADVGLGALLIIAETPLWLAPLAVLWLPTYLTLYQGKRVDRLTFWWLAALLLSSAAIGSRMI